MLKLFRAFGRWMRTRYGNKPKSVQVGTPPYRATEQKVQYPTHFAMLVWRMVMEGADKTANFSFRHWKAIILLSLLIVATLSWRRWHGSVVATVDIWSIEQQKKAASAQAEKAKLDEAQAKAAASAQAEKAKLDEANAQAAASAQAEKAKLDEARAKAAASASASAQAEKAKLDEARTQDGEKMKPRAYYVNERYWVCIHKVVKCAFNGRGDQYDSNNVVNCVPSYSTTGGGFDSPHCPEGDAIQTTMVLKMQNGPEKIIVPNDVYGKHEKDSWVFLMCNQLRCDSEIVDPPPEPHASPAPSASSPPAPQPSAASASTPDPSRVVQR